MGPFNPHQIVNRPDLGGFYYGTSTDIKLAYQLDVVREVMGIRRGRSRKRDEDEMQMPTTDWKGWFLKINSNLPAKASWT